MNTEIKVGDKVQWMNVSGINSVTFSTRYGVVEEIAGKIARVKILKSSKRVEMAIRRLVPINQPSPVNHVFGALTEHLK